jgi:hypothetical protein
MHTYIKQSDIEYNIGMWLLHPEGYHRFNILFTVPNLKQAFTAVNMLNGGTRISPDALTIVEKE